MTRLLLLLALTSPFPRVMIYRATLHPIPGGYTAIPNGPVLCGETLLPASSIIIEGATMRVMCPPGERVTTFMAAWVDLDTPERRKP